MACDPNTLAREGGCFFCLPGGYYYPIKLAILARWLKTLDPGADTSPLALMADPVAKCFACPPGAQLGPLKLALICDATSGGGGLPPSAPSDLTIDLSSTAGQVIPVWTNNGGATTNEIWKSVNGAAFLLYATVPGGDFFYTDLAAMPVNDYWEYEVRAVNGAGQSAFTTPAGAANGLDDHASVNISYPNLIISFDIMDFSANAALLTASFPRLLQSAAISFNSATALTTISFPVLQSAGFLDFDACSALATAAFPALTTVFNQITFNGATILASLNLNALTFMGGILDLTSTAIVTLSLPVLINTDGIVAPAINSLTSVSCPALATVGNNGLQFNDCTSMASADFTAVTGVNGPITFTNDSSLTGLTMDSLGFCNSTINLSLSGLTTFSFASLVTVAGGFVASACTSLAGNISLPSLTDVGGTITFQSSTMANLFCTALLTVGSDFNASSCPNLIEIAATALTTVGVDLNFGSDPSLTTVTFTSLQTVGGSLLFGSDPVLTSANFFSLTSVGSNLIGNANSAITSIDLSALVSVGADIILDACAVLPSLSLGALTTLLGSISVAICPMLTSFSAPSWTITDGTTINFDSDALNAASEEGILAAGIASAVGTCDFELANGTNAGLTTLSAQGQTDYANLGIAGNTTNINP